VPPVVFAVMLFGPQVLATRLPRLSRDAHTGLG
jgi:hypothetical protein